MGTFYRFVNGKLSCKSGVGPLKTDCDQLILDDTEKAEILNNYFMSIFTADNGNLPDFGRRVDESVFINHVEFTSLDCDLTGSATASEVTTEGGIEMRLLLLLLLLSNQGNNTR